MALCGWKFNDDSLGKSEFQEIVSGLEYNGDFEKAAGFTFLYYADLNRTIECLNSSRSIGD